ncbi:hypothetical protein [Fodinibius sediminis]|uniref:Uncharacterized protein n=1 Tax=Fodinibius sediminis TaxID=1214077 RepID=A0A521DX53_9BACT|nr:hypothetical protein [Fodinibius sediminis]SMO76293.1 hypothetical protein SAMN06265218_11232 [Fodinibius sediminis]
MNNIGFIPQRREESPEGIEKNLAIHHLAPFLLTNIITKHLRRADTARLVTLSSEAHGLGARFFDLNNL